MIAVGLSSYIKLLPILLGHGVCACDFEIPYPLLSKLTHFAGDGRRLSGWRLRARRKELP